MYEPDLQIYVPIYVLTMFLLLYGLYSNLIKEKLYLSESLVATCIGIIFGPFGLGLLSLSSESIQNYRIFLHFSRLVLAIQIMAAGIALPQAYLRRHWKSLGILLGPVLAGSWLITSVLLYLCFWEQFTWLEALLVGAILSPTDPILANSIVKGRFAESHVPLYLRTLLSAESAANDSFILPAIHILLMLMIEGRKKLVVPITQLLSELIFDVIVWKIGGGLVVGVFMGHLSKTALMKAERYKYIDKESLVAFNFALALVTCSLALLIGVSDLLALFVTGLVFSWDAEVEDDDDESEFQNVIDALFNLSYFVMFGASLSWLVLWSDFGVVRLLEFSLLILGLRRLPIVVLLSPWISQLKTPKEALFCGWFGPMGVGALFYSSYAVLLGCSPLIFQITSAMVLASVFAHGVTVPLFHLTTLHRTFSLLPPDEDEAAEILTTLLTESGSEGSLVLSETTILDLQEPLSGY